MGEPVKDGGAMKYGEAYAAGGMILLYGVGLLQDIPRRDAWAFVLVGIAVAIVAVAASVFSVVLEARRRRRDAPKPPELLGSEIMAAMRAPIRVTFIIPPESRLFMARAAARLRVSPEEITRRAVTSFLDRHGAQEVQQ